jgi:cytochrome c biogenesis protein CcmG, thiol:disulfide interchange protein DsbE
MRFRRFIIPGCVVVAAAALLALLTYGVSNHTDTASIDYKVSSKHFPAAPHYTEGLPVLGGSVKRSLASFKGKVVVLNVYASWCPPCQQEAPMLARMQKTIAREGATFVGVTYETSAAQAEQFDRKYGITYPVLRDVDGNFVRSFGTYQLPETFIINRQGKIQALQRSEISSKWLTRNLKIALRETT